MWFRRKPKITREEALAARPVRLPAADLQTTEEGGGRLVVPFQPRWKMFRAPPGATRTFELDAIGVFVWNCCDGRTSVQQMIRKLADRYRLNLREAEVSLLQFMFTLVRKGLVGMEMKQK